MRYKTTDKVRGEIVLGGLNLVLKKNSTFDIDKQNSSHHELLWAIHNQYVEAVDVDAKKVVSNNKKIYTNNSKKTITSSFLKSPMIPGQYIILSEDDPSCVAMDKLVEMKLIDCSSNVEERKNVEAEDVSNKKSESKPEIRASFNKNKGKKASSNSKKKEEVKEDNLLNNEKINSESKPTVFSPKEKTIFVGENNEELDI